jgi:hypothetical protein
MRDFRQVTANLQLAYAQAASEGAPAAKEEPNPAASSSASDQPKFEPEDLEPVEDEELGGGG